MSSFDVNTPVLNASCSSCYLFLFGPKPFFPPSGPMNSASFLAVSVLARNTRGLGSLSLTPGQVSSSAPRPPTMYAWVSPLPHNTGVKRVGNNASVFGRASEQSRRISFGNYWHGTMFADRDRTKSLRRSSSFVLRLAKKRTLQPGWPTLPLGIKDKMRPFQCSFLVWW